MTITDQGYIYYSDIINYFGGGGWSLAVFQIRIHFILDFQTRPNKKPVKNHRTYYKNVIIFLSKKNNRIKFKIIKFHKTHFW